MSKPPTTQYDLSEFGGEAPTYDLSEFGADSSSVPTTPSFKRLASNAMSGRNLHENVGATPEEFASQQRKNRGMLLPTAGALLASPGGVGTMALGAGLGEMANQEIKKLPNQTFIESGEPNFGLNPFTDPIAQTTAFAYAGGKALELAPKALPPIAKSVAGFVRKYTPSNIRQALHNMSESGIKPFTEGIRKSLTNSMYSKGEEFGSVIDTLSEKNMSNPTNISSALDSLSQESLTNNKVANLINRHPKLKTLLDEYAVAPDKANMSLKDSQELLKSIKSDFSHSKLKGYGIKYDELPIFKDVINEIRLAQHDSLPLELKAAFKGALKDFGSAKEDYRLLRTSLNPNNIEETIKTNFGGSKLKRVAAKGLIPREIESMDVARSVEGIKKHGIKRLGIGVLAEEATLGKLRKMLGW